MIWNFFKKQFRSFVLAAVLFITCSYIWDSYAPVVFWMAPQKIENTDNKIIAFHVTGYKIKNCRFVPRSRFGQAKQDGVWVEVPFLFLEDESEDSTKPKSWEKQSFGNWFWDISKVPNADEVRLVAFHDCGGGVITSTFGGWAF